MHALLRAWHAEPARLATGGDERCVGNDDGVVADGEEKRRKTPAVVPLP